MYHVQIFFRSKELANKPGQPGSMSYAVFLFLQYHQSPEVCTVLSAGRNQLSRVFRMTIEMPLVLSPSQSLELQFKISKYPLKFSLHNILCKIAVSRDTICFLSPVKKPQLKRDKVFKNGTGKFVENNL